MKIFGQLESHPKLTTWVKTKPRLAGNQIPFGGTRFGFTTVGIYNRSRILSIVDIYIKSNLVPQKGI